MAQAGSQNRAELAKVVIFAVGVVRALHLDIDTLKQFFGGLEIQFIIETMFKPKDSLSQQDKGNAL